MTSSASTLTPVWFNENHRDRLTTLCQKHTDDTAFFVYDLDALQQHLEVLQQQDVVKLWYAVKANPLSAIVQTLAKTGFNFDVASSGELNQVLNQGVGADKVLNTGPAKSRRQISEFLDKGVRIFVVESVNQLQWLNEAAQARNIVPQVLLRVQLRWPDDEKNPLGGNTLTPFGLSTEDWSGISLEDYQSIDVAGLHIFQWGNMLDNERMKCLWSQMVPPLKSLASDLGINFRILDLGGGLGIDYVNSEKSLNWPQIIDDLATIKANAGVKEIWLELGRYAVAECGYYLAPVVDRKTNAEKEQLVLAAGINHIIRPAITEQPFPVTALKSSNEETQEFEIHGPLCTSLDKLGSLALPQDVDVNDFIVFGYCGAYGFTESMPFFLCHPIAAEYVIKANQIICVRAGQQAEWYLS